MTPGFDLESTGSTSGTLLARVKDGDSGAWQRLVDIYGPLVYRWCRSRGGLQAQDAADVTQEVFSAVSRAISSFRRDRPQDGFRRWLWTITRNKVIDHTRATSRNDAVGGSAANALLQLLPDQCPETDEESRQLNAAVHRGVEQVRAEFEPRTWQAFWKTVVLGQRTSDVAEELGMGANNVRQARSRVLRRLRTRLEGLFD